MKVSEHEQFALGLCDEKVDPRRLGASGPAKSILVTIATRLPAFLLFGIGYVLACKYANFFSERTPAPLWFPDSVLLCALLLAPEAEWPWYLLLGFPIRLLTSHVPAWFFLAAYANDCMKALLSAYVLRRWQSRPQRLNTLRQFGMYLAVAGFAAPALSGVGGAIMRARIDRSFWVSWYEWFSGDLTAALVLTPTLLYWCSGEWRILKARRYEFAGLLLAFALCLYFIFGFLHSGYSPAILYAPMPFLILAAIRLYPIGVSTFISVLAVVSICTTYAGNGPFLSNFSEYGLVSMQVFLWVVSIPILCIAILLVERRSVEKDLDESRTILRANYLRVQDLAGKLLIAQEHERLKIARELHDDIGQRLALLALKLEERFSSVVPETEIERSISDSLQQEIAELCSAVHDLSHQLHSTTLQQMGLTAALRSLCRTIERQHNVTVNFESEHKAPLSDEQNLCLFRVAQEALRNAIVHGAARQVQVSLCLHEKSVTMTVKDTGTGFNPEKATRGLGLVSMRERARMLGGTVAVISEPGAGTEIAAELPLAQSA